ncbi:MAG: hypothetical protein WA902_03695 [Thermosynechococcaceae cyanobacterium]
MSQKNWGFYPSLVTAGLLAGCLGLALVGCKNIAHSQGQPSDISSEGIAAQVNQDENQKNHAAVDDGAPVSPSKRTDDSEIAPAPQQSSSASEGDPLRDQNFSQALLRQILKADRGCFNFEAVCSHRKFIFKDSALIVGPVDSGEVRNVSLIPNQAISQQQALSYAKILDDNGDVDFENSKNDGPETVSYGGACPGYDSEAVTYSCYVMLHITSNGEVSKVELVHSSD